MVIIAFADLHGHTSLIEPILRKESDVDVVLLAGDITHFGGTMEIESIVSQIRCHAPTTFAVAGNCDYPEVESWMSDEGLSLHGRCQILGNLAFVGAGSSLPCPGTTPNECEEADFERCLNRAFSGVPPGMPAVLLAHEPPHGTKVDLAGRGGHVGSREVREAIERNTPLLCCCGHIHEAAGTDRVKNCLTANPGPLSRGKYVRAVVSGTTVEAQIRSVGSR